MRNVLYKEIFLASTVSQNCSGKERRFYEEGTVEIIFLSPHTVLPSQTGSLSYVFYKDVGSISGKSFEAIV